MNTSVIRFYLVVSLISSCLTNYAQTGLMLTKKGGDTQFIDGTDFSFENIEQLRYGAIKCDTKSIYLSDITKIEPFPYEITNGNAEDVFTPTSTIGLHFVGAWEGANHTLGTKSTPHQGIWEFHNDGTFSWVGTDVKGQDMDGIWNYDPKTNIIATNSLRCPALTVISVFDDMVLIKNETYNQMYTLSRISSPSYEVSLNAPLITQFRPDGFVIRVSFVNHKFINYPSYKYGISYSTSNSPNVFERVYASTCEQIEMPKLGGDWEGIIYAYDNFPFIGGDVCLNGFNLGDKLIIRPFVEFADGSVIYGEDLKIKVINPPANGIFLGEKLSNGKASFWYCKGISKNGSNSYYGMSIMKPADAENAIQQLGDGWEIPSYIPKMFRFRDYYYSSDFCKVELNLYSPINGVSSLYSFFCSDTFYLKERSFLVKQGSKYYTNWIFMGNGVEFSESLSKADDDTEGFLIPCKKVSVNW